MITIRFRRQNGQFTGFSTVGHAEFEEYGKDIVCAGVSALVINTINSIESLTGQEIITEEMGPEGIGRIEFLMKAPLGEDANLLMKSLKMGLDGIADQYNTKKKHVISVEIEEV